MQNPWSSAMTQNTQKAMLAASQLNYVHNRISTPWSHINDVQKKKEVPHTNQYMYDANGQPITATVAPSDANIVSRFSNAYTGKPISDKHSIIDLESTRRTTSVYEQPYWRGEKREHISTRRNDRQLPDTLMHESKFPSTGGYHSTGPHPEVRAPDTNTPSFTAPVSVSHSHRKHSRLMNVRLNTHENNKMQRNIEMPSQAFQQNDMQYTQQPEFSAQPPLPTAVSSESSLSNPQVSLVPENAASFGNRRHKQLQTELTKRDLQKHLKPDNASLNHTSIQTNQRSMGTMGKVTLADLSLTYDHMNKPDRHGNTQIQLRPNEALKDDNASNIAPRMQKRGSQHTVKSHVSLSAEDDQQPQSQFMQTQHKAQPLTSDITLKEEDLLTLAPAMPSMTSRATKPIEHHTHKDDASHALESHNASHNTKHALRNQAVNSNRVSDMHISSSTAQFPTQHSGKLGTVQVSRSVPQSQPLMNFFSFIKAMITPSQTQINKQPTKMIEPAKVVQKGNSLSPITQEPHKVTLDKIQLKPTSMHTAAADRKQVTMGITNNKMGYHARMPGGNRGNIQK